ncbi:MAG: ArgE/DapE family deacylase [Ardenticatenaceae bacterium]|nr:ArgE/DapE family deacylase [Ardenticatenaceae bacterium]MCB9444416.1 ArgE/DapE family deacylase [Ardenticatenaceae bacterium]
MNLQIDRDYLVQTMVDLVRINSTNPSLSPDGAGEVEIGAYVADALNDLGLEVTTYDLGPKRVNVVGRLAGKGNGRSLLLNAHMDTVGVAGMTDPFSAEIRDGKLYGRGSQDMKGSLAAQIAAAKALVDAGVELAGDLWVTAVADEEFLSIGSDDLVKHVRADAAIVTEPTDLHICRAHRGFIWYDVETFGRAAHGSRYAEGIDANMRMGRFLAQLDYLEQELRARPPHPLAGPPSLHASRIHGGNEISIYAAHCKLEIERRTIPGETEALARAELQAIIDQLASDPTFRATVKATFLREPFEVAEDAAIVQALHQVTADRLNRQPQHSGQTFWTDAAIFAQAGMETVLIGPIGQGLHSAEEWVDVQSVVDLAAILAETAVHYCQ